MRLLKHVTLLLLVASLSLCKASSEDWVDYDDEDDAAPWGRELVEVSPDAAAGNRLDGYGSAGGFYGPSGGGMVASPYGMPSPPVNSLTPPPVNSPPAPPPPRTAAAASYSTSATVPGVRSTSKLNSYATVDAFNTTERLRFRTTLESNIFRLLNTPANVTIDSVTPGSINVANTIAFTGSDSTESSTAAASLVTALNSGDTSIFGTSFGTVEVSGVTAANTTNPTTSSGASSLQWALLPIAVAVIAVVTVTLVGTST